MKKLFLLLIFFLTSCAPATPVIPAITATPEPITHPELEAFQTSDTCPNVCWLGIHVGTTTRQQAIDIFTNAPGNANMRVTPNTLEGEWITNKEKIWKAFVAIHFKDDMVDSLMLGRLAPFTTDDFIKILGEPSKMWILWADDRVGHGFGRTQYALYYPDQKIEVQSGYVAYDGTGWDGPRPNAKVEWLRVGVAPQHPDQYIQPWLGYGHLEDYRPKAVPTPVQ